VAYTVNERMKIASHSMSYRNNEFVLGLGSGLDLVSAGNDVDIILIRTGHTTMPTMVTGQFADKP